MFETRLKVLMFFLLFALAIIVTRLVDMQVVHADAYRQQAEDALLRRPTEIPAIRGRILDRGGAELATEEPCWDIRVPYRLLPTESLAMDSAYLTAWVDRSRRDGTYGANLSEAEIRRRILSEVDRMWSDLSDFSGEPREEILARAVGIRERIRGIREAVTERRGFDAPVREENQRHPIVTGLDDQEQVAARALLRRYPWVAVEDSTTRVIHAGVPFAHVLGRLGPVTAKELAEDPFADDATRMYTPTERFGITGVESVAEPLLRGWRGRFQTNRRGETVEDIAPRAGRDVHLTIRRDLQESLYEMFGQEISRVPDCPGGSIVVLDVASRECLALVSYPAFDPATFQERYAEWRVDTVRQPMRFRAVSNQYAPGSIVKPLVCLAGLNAGAITLETRFDCQGALFSSHPDKWRCWSPAGTSQRMRHGPVNATEAIKHSCNIFMYHTGELVGVSGLTNYFEMVLFGQTSGTGLIEEKKGINPTPSWLSSVAGQSVTPGKARHLAIGQAEVSVTPIQAANLMAAYASGERKYVTLIRELSDSARWTLPGDTAHWRAIRQGLYGVVNDTDGTSHKTAYLDPSTGYALCGKTGSAQARSWPVSYRIPYVDADDNEDVAIVRSTTRKGAEEDFVREFPGCAFDRLDVTVHERWPPHPPTSGDMHSHAWFVGYLQPVDASGQPIWSQRPPIAFAVMVEFGGSGGRVAGPIGKKVAEVLIATLGPGLDADAPPRDVEAEGARE
jgi:cell division protein FtsI/penicillin-binding protein 2